MASPLSEQLLSLISLEQLFARPSFTSILSCSVIIPPPNRRMMASDDEKQTAKLGQPELGTVGSIQEIYPSQGNALVGGLHRRLNNRQIQLIAAGGSIGTALFISIGGGLAKGGPASLVIAYTVYSIILAFVNNSIAEMNTYMPVAGGFVRLAGYWVDDALGFLAGWNFFIYEALIIPFEVTALTFTMSFWSEEITTPGPTAGVCAAVIVLYGAINILAVRFYGEAEFWLSGGKLILIFILFAFTFVTMVGGNPLHDAYGFRYWSSPGAFAEYITKGDLGRFEGFLAALWSASFTVVGPEYISMVAAEAKRPSVYIKAAFKTVYFRFCIFFVVGALAVSVVVPYNDPVLYNIYFGDGAGGSAAASPYVIAMSNIELAFSPTWSTSSFLHRFSQPEIPTPIVQRELSMVWHLMAGHPRFFVIAIRRVCRCTVSWLSCCFPSSLSSKSAMAQLKS
uniref:Amino acid permease/ SLC12A domain-containing protein n=1 Tax=Bionectria ochroleuca TaxID=29856 RepID=A0A8H7TTE5_BIOOC